MPTARGSGAVGMIPVKDVSKSRGTSCQKSFFSRISMIGGIFDVVC